jgi:hypothetical protein
MGDIVEERDTSKVKVTSLLNTLMKKLIVALAFSSVVLPSQANDRNDIAAGIVGGMIIGSIIQQHVMPYMGPHINPYPQPPIIIHQPPVVIQHSCYWVQEPLYDAWGRLLAHRQVRVCRTH